MLRFIVLLAAVSASAHAFTNGPPNGLSVSAWSSIRAEYQRHRQAVFQEGGGHRARNYGQRWSTRFDSRGFDVSPDAGGWRWGLELQSYGFPGQETSVQNSRATADVEKLFYRWDSHVTEWFVNGNDGLEHGFTLASRPGKSSGPLTLHLRVRGTLEPRVSADRRWVTFVDDRRAPVLNYAGLKVTDAQGRELAARFLAEPERLRLEVDERGARYPITIDPIAQQAYLKPAAVATTQAGDWFGYSVAISGDTVVVGAPQEDSSSLGVNSAPNELAGASGAAYVFTRSAGVWSQQAYLKPALAGPGGQAGDHFGWSVAVSGDTVVVGAPSEDSSTVGTNSTPLEGASDSGAAYVFIRSGVAWSQQAYLKPPIVGTSRAGTGFEFGWSVAISGDTVAVGAYDEPSSSTGVNSSPNELATGAGAAYVFARSGVTWSQQAYLKPAAVGTTQANDHFGAAIAVSVDTVVVGAFQEDSSSTGINSTPNELSGGSGAAYIFARSAGVWSQQAYLKPAMVGSTQAGEFFGTSVAVSGDTVVVGANHESSSTLGVNTTPNEGAGSSGAVYVFTRGGGVWSQQAYVKPSTVGTTQSGDNFGISVAISGDTMVVGADGEDSSSTGIDSMPNESAALSGAAYVFTRSAGIWSQQAYLKPGAVGSTQAGDTFGWSVGVSGDTAVVGAYLEDSSSLGINSAPNEAAVDSGAAYVFTVSVDATGGESKAVITSPTPGSTLSGSSVAFAWTPGTGASSYRLDVATTAGGSNLFSQNVGLATLQAVTGLPTDGSTIYVRLWTALSAGNQFNDFAYKASGASSGGGSPSITAVSEPGNTPTLLSPGAFGIIQGNNFGTQPSVTVNGTGATVFNSTNTSVVFQVPATAPVGPVSFVVSTSAGPSLPFPFTLSAVSPSILLLSPATGQPTSFQTASGDPVYAAASGDIVRFAVDGLGTTLPPPAPALLIDGQGVPVLSAATASWLFGPAAKPANVAAIFLTVPNLTPGRHSLAIRAGGVTTTSVPLVIFSSGLILTQSGLTFNAVQGGPKLAPQAFGVFNGGGNIPLDVSTSTFSGGSGWLLASLSSDPSQQGQTGTAVKVAIDPTGLAQGAYYGLVQISSQGVSNSPQSVSVVLNVAAPDTNLGPTLDTNGLIFVGTPSGAPPSPQTVTIWNPTPAALSFTSSVAVDSGTNQFTVSPSSTTINPGQSVVLNVQASVAGASAGQDRATVTLAFSGGVTRSISLLLVVGSVTKANAISQVRPALAGCTPTKLLPVFTQPGASFNLPAAWPASLAVSVVDDCGSPLTTGNVRISFSNGDPPLTLTSSLNGSWTATWPPRYPVASGITMTVNAAQPGLNLQGSAAVTGGVSVNNVPMVFSGGIVDLASYSTQISPGGMIAIFGSELSAGNGDAPTFPLPPLLQGTSVILSGKTLPLRATSPGQIAAMIPFDVPLNTNLQLIVQNGTSIATPQSIAVVPALPGVFTPDSSGKGQGHIYTVDAGGNQILANSSAPAKPGALVVIYCAGLGAVTPAAQAGFATPLDSFTNTVNPVTVTIGGKTAAVPVFQGLIPGVTGIYEIVVAVPAGLPDDDNTQLTVTVLGQDSTPVTFALRN